MLRPEREHHPVVVGCGLQLEVEAHAEALAQREAPGAVDPRSERRVHDELHPARLVEEALEDHVRVGRHDAEPVARGADVVDQLLRAGEADARLLDQRVGERLDIVEALGDLAAQAADLLAQLDRAAGALAEPERDRRRRAARVHDPHRAALDAADAPRGAAEQEDVACHALDRPVLVDRADHGLVGLGDHAVVAQLGDRAAVLDCDHARGAAGAQHAGDAIAVQQRLRSARALADAAREHREHLVVVLALEVAVRRGATHEVEQLVLAPLARGALGDDLLRQHVERRDRLHDLVEAARADRPRQRRALHQLVARAGEDAPLGPHAERVPGAPDALQEGRDAARRADLADEIDRADVDTQFERGRRHQRAQLAVLEPLLQPQPPLLREAAVVAGDVLLADALRELVRDPLREPPRVDEDERRAVLRDQLGDALVDLAPLLGRGDRLEVSRRQLDGEVEVALVAEVDDRAVRLAVRIEAIGADEEARDLLDRPLRRRESDARGPLAAGLGDELVEPRQREGEVAASPVAGDGVDLVDDHGADAPQVLAAALGGDQQVERLRRGDQDVRRLAHHRLPLALRRVAAAHCRADRRAARGRVPRRPRGSPRAASRGCAGCRCRAPSVA